MTGAANTRWFVALGLLLAASTLAGYAWELVEQLGCVPGFGCSDGRYYGGPYSETVRLGNAGLLAAILGWSAFAPTATRAALRGPIALVVVPVLLGLLVYGGSELVSAIQDASRSDEFKPVNEYYLSSWVVIDPLSVVIVALGTVAGLALFGALAHEAISPNGGLRRWPSWLLLAPFAAEAIRDLWIGAEVAALLTIVSALWLLAALRLASRSATARSRRQAERATA